MNRLKKGVGIWGWNGQRETKRMLRGICYYCRGTSRLELDEQISDAVILFVERNIRYPR